MEHESFENPGMAASGGAGIQSAQFVINKGIEAVLTGNVGPNAYTALQAAGVKIFTGLDGTVRGMVEQYKHGNMMGFGLGKSGWGRWMGCQRGFR